MIARGEEFELLRAVSQPLRSQSHHPLQNKTEEELLQNKSCLYRRLKKNRRKKKKSPLQLCSAHITGSAELKTPCAPSNAFSKLNQRRCKEKEGAAVPRSHPDRGRTRLWQVMLHLARCPPPCSAPGRALPPPPGAPAEDPAAPALRGAGGVSALSSTRSGSHGLLQTLSFPAQTCANCRQRQALLSWSARPSGHACFSQPTAHPALVAAGGGPHPNWSLGCLVAAKRALASCLCDLA